ncbi:MAG: hypothetical protein AAFY48_04790 [Bacteroidota bacterium]
MQNILFLSLLLSSTAIFCQANLLVGYWQVNEVTLAGDTQTPVSKWFHLGEDGNLQGGNGGNINIFGTWENPTKTEVLFFNREGVADPAGPFTFRKEKELLILEREEGGLHIKVTLQAFELGDWPIAPWDQVAGAWTLSSETGLNKEDLGYSFSTASFQWDHIVVFNGDDDVTPIWAALWRIHAHRIQLELAPTRYDIPFMRWDIEFTDDQMIWTRNFEGNPQRLVWTKKQ